MARDTFKRTAPTIEFFKDGETIRAKKLSKIMEKTQDGLESLEAAMGDLHNRAATFAASPLFQNSVARSIGQMNELNVFPNREFAAIQRTKVTLNYGLIRWPYANTVAATAGNRSRNLLPTIEQLDKTGIGCARDNGHRCLAGYDRTYNDEKNLVLNGTFQEELQLSGWNVTDAQVREGGGIDLDLAYRYNLLNYSENFEDWSTTGPTLTVQRDSLPDPNEQSATYKIELSSSIDETILLSSQGQGANSDTDWCFSVWMAASGERTAYLAMSGVSPSETTGSLDGGSFTRDGVTYYGVRLSGTDWQRYWFHAKLPASAAANEITAQIVMNVSGVGDPTALYVFGAQLEPGNYPTTYQRTQGSTTSGFASESSVGYILNTIPGHLYQVTLEGTGSIQARLDGSALFTLSSGRTYGTFRATADSHTIDAYVSGTVASNNHLTSFRIDPGFPCHAMNCPGFSAYNKVRKYRAVLPQVTVSGHQYFATQLQLPDEFQKALFDEIPGNIMGIFDHELNHAVPDVLVNWKLANWPIGGRQRAGLVNDPGFYEDWRIVTPGDIPSEFIEEGTSGTLTRDRIIVYYSGTLTGIPPGIPPEDLGPRYWHFDAADISGFNQGDEVDFWFNRGSSWDLYGGKNDGYLAALAPDYYPILELSGHGGRPYMAWNKPFNGGVTQFLNLSGNQAGRSRNMSIGSGQAVTAWFVTKGPNTLDGGGPFYIGGNVNGASRTGWQTPRTSYIGASNNVTGTGYDSQKTGPLEFRFGMLWDPDTDADQEIVSGALLITVITRNAAGESATHLIQPALGIYVKETDYDVCTESLTFNSIGSTRWESDQHFTTSGARVYEFGAWSGVVLTDAQISGLIEFLAYKYQGYDVQPSGYTAGDPTSSGTWTDRLIMESSTSGDQGVKKYFVLTEGEVYDWIYTIKGNTGPSGVYESYLALSGSAEVDLFLNGEYQAIPSGTPLLNYYQVSGSVYPGVSPWASVENEYWTIRRRIKATSTGAVLSLGVVVPSGETSPVILDDFDVERRQGTSTFFEYCNAPVLGKNWEGSASHIIRENLWKWSERPDYFNYNASGLDFQFEVVDPSGLLGGTRFFGSGIGQTFVLNELLDSTLTLQFWGRSNNFANVSGQLQAKVTLSGVLYEQDFDLDGTWKPFSLMIDSLDMNTVGMPLKIEILTPQPGNEMDIAWLTLHHGSGIVPYEKTYGKAIKRYRYVLEPSDPTRIEDNWGELYGLVGSRPLQVSVTGPMVSGGLIQVAYPELDFDNFPPSGVVQIIGQEIAYRGKSEAGAFLNCVPGWRGTEFNEPLITSGLTATYVPLPRPIERIDEDGLVYFREPLPVTYGDWASNVRLQLYNTQIPNFDRFSLTASAVPLTRAVGSLMTAFTKHAADDAQHFRRDQLCAALVDPSTYGGFDDMEVRLTVEDDIVQEINEQVILNIFAFGFMGPTDKEITIWWGDRFSGTTTITRTGKVFNSIGHTYDLGFRKSSRPTVGRSSQGAVQHTITVEVKDLDLRISRRGTIAVLVTPVKKASQKVRTVIITEETASQTARTAIWAPISGVQQARTYITS